METTANICRVLLTVLLVEAATGSNVSCKIFTKDRSGPAVIARNPGESVILNCTVMFGGPVEEITWKKDGNHLTTVAGPVSSSLLTLKHLSAWHPGVYECLIRSSDSQDISQIILRMNKPPHITVTYTSLSLCVGDQIKIPCTATGVPTPAITWLRGRGHRTLRHGDMKGRVSLRREANALVLIIDKATKDDKGLYICHANNTAGERVQSVYVAIRYERYYGTVSVTTSHPRRTVTGKIREDVSLTCKGINTPKAVTYVFWKFNGKMMKIRGQTRIAIKVDYKAFYKGRYKTEELISTLSIKSLRDTDEGVYTCAVVSLVALRSVNIHLQVIDPGSEIPIKHVH